MNVSEVTGAEGVDSVSVFPEIAALVFSNIYVSIYAYVYRSFERFTYWG